MELGISGAWHLESVTPAHCRCLVRWSRRATVVNCSAMDLKRQRALPPERQTVRFFSSRIGNLRPCEEPVAAPQRNSVVAIAASGAALAGWRRVTTSDGSARRRRCAAGRRRATRAALELNETLLVRNSCRSARMPALSAARPPPRCVHPRCRACTPQPCRPVHIHCERARSRAMFRPLRHYHYFCCQERPARRELSLHSR